MIPATKIDPTSKVSMALQPTIAPSAPAIFQSPAPRLRSRTNGKSTSSPTAAPSREVLSPAQRYAIVFTATPMANAGTVSQLGIRRLRKSVHPAAHAKAIAGSRVRTLKLSPRHFQREAARHRREAVSHRRKLYLPSKGEKRHRLAATTLIFSGEKSTDSLTQGAHSLFRGF